VIFQELDNGEVNTFHTASAIRAACVRSNLGENEEMSKKIYVGNLSYEATEESVSEMLAEYGKVDSMAWITDRDSGRFRGFCFVEMEESAANAAIRALNDKDLDGRMLRVNEARPREDRSSGRSNSKYPHSGGGSF
jgi:RNA recognition motif-containing protein